MKLEVTPDSYSCKYAKQFVKDMLNAGYIVYHYYGKFFFEGPAVNCNNIQEVIKATKQELQYDHLGTQYVIYPRKAASLIKEDKSKRLERELSTTHK